MLKNFYGKKGQNVSAEYVILIALASIAIVGMTTYVRRALQGRYRDANRAVYVRAAATLGAPVQAEYEPYYVNTTADTDSSSFVQETSDGGGVIDRVDSLDRSVNSVSTQKPF